jgi:hypothetical protein
MGSLLVGEWFWPYVSVKYRLFHCRVYFGQVSTYYSRLCNTASLNEFGREVVFLFGLVTQLWSQFSIVTFFEAIVS